MDISLSYSYDEKECRSRATVMALEDAMREMEQVEIEPVHYFAPGLYAREITIPEGVTLTGKIHRTEHICILSKGEVVVHSLGSTERYSAPATIISKPGAKRAIYAVSEAVWTNFHPTTETDLEKIEDDLIAPTFQALDESREILICHG